MKNLLLSLSLSLFALCSASDLLAQGAPPTPSTRSSPAEPEFEMFEFTEADMPHYDDAELARLIHYPAEAKAGKIEGRVIVQFIVNTSGRAEKIEVVNGADPLLSAAAIDAIGNLPFTPAYQQGKLVRVRMTIPIVFQLQY